VSEYGKVLGLVTMDDLLAQIFGVLRDERADLQQSIPPGRLRASAASVPRPESDSGPAPDSSPVLELGPVEPAPAAAAEAVDGEGGGAVGGRDGEGDRGAEGDREPGGAADPGGDPDGDADRDRAALLHPPPGLRPIHEVDEITPPAIDLAELRREHERGGGGS
jgi:hypothetical protein